MASYHLPFGTFLILLGFLIPHFLSFARAYEVPILDTDYSRQICSGMWGGSSAFINVSFAASSQGQLAMVIYEWADAKYLGNATGSADEDLPKTYICTSSAVLRGFCMREQLGHFILDLPSGKTINDTSFWSARVDLPANKSSASRTSAITADSFWDNPAGNPAPPASSYDSPWRRRSSFSSLVSFRRQINSSPADIYSYTSPISYPVRKTGFYCVAVIPVTVQSPTSETDITHHPSYNGLVLFKNTFDGKLAATDYPKVNFYFAMFIVYSVFGTTWAWLCYQHMQELLPIQYYLSGLVALLITEMVANWGYYRYLNAHGRSAASTAFLIVVAILDAGRNSMSFFMLLVVSLGLNVVRESLGRTMLKCQALAVAHFIFGILYAIGIVELELESTSALILLLFIIPLAFTLSGFLLWIMYALNATIAQLRARKQRYKLKMFERLYYILLFSVLIIGVFFVVSSMSFSGRLAEDYAAKTWRVRWWLLDGWLALLYLVSFIAVAFLWRPTANNRRLAMSDEIAQEDEEAEDYDLEAIQLRSQQHGEEEEDTATLVGGRRGGPDSISEDHVVFEIGDEEDEDDDASKKRRVNRLSGEDHGGEEEHHSLIR